jgi:uncharacterized repeat protein (TIGR03843 family)
MRNVRERLQIHLNSIVEILHEGSIQLKGQFTFGSNYTFLISVKYKNSSYRAIYKPQKGEIPLWDFPPDTLANRETAAFLISEALSWGYVPPTIIRPDAPFGRGSLQWFIQHEPEMNYFTFSKEMKENLRPVGVFDMILNNADRKGSHVIIDDRGQIWLIDHGVCFHHKPKLRTVIWDFIGERISDQIIHDLHLLNHKLTQNSPLMSELEHLLSLQELTDLKRRVEHIISVPFFPMPDKNSRPFPFPLV